MWLKIPKKSNLMNFKIKYIIHIVMIKQLHIVPDIAISSGGLGLAALRYAESVSKAGAEVTLLTMFHSTETLLRPTFDLDNFRLIHTPFHSFKLQHTINFYQSMEAVCKQNKFDFFHLHGVWSPLYIIVWLIARKHKIPYMVSPHGCFESWALNHKRWKKRLALMTYQGEINSDAALFFATAEQEYKSIRCLNITQPIAIIPNGVDVGILPEKHQRKGRRVILFLSRIHPKKGLLDLVEVWAKVRNQNWRIVIAGPDENGHQSEVQKAIALHGLESDFEFIGLVEGDKKSACFANAELFVLPTYSENFGIAIAEALANALPVITTTGAPWRDLQDYGCGWWVSPGVVGLTKALKVAIATDPMELRRMGDRGRQLVSEKYSWDKIGCDALSVYNAMINNVSLPLDVVRVF